MKLTGAETLFLAELLREFEKTENVEQMKKAMVHGGATVYEHTLRVVELSYWMSCRLHIGLDRRSLVRGAFLHDFYLYDWHTGGPRFHGWRHPAIALENARREFTLNKKEENIIASHMWPMTFRVFPRSMEAVVVSLADKLCALQEDFYYRLYLRLNLPVSA